MIDSLTANQLVLIALALALGGLTKGLTGLGLPLVSVPVLAAFFGVERAVLIMVIPSFVLNAYQTWMHRAEARELPELRRLLLAGVPGAAIGATILRMASDRFLTTSLGIWILAYVLMRYLHPHYAITMPNRWRWSPAVGTAAGALQAATGISAPVVAPYMDALNLKPRAYVFGVCVCFGAFAGAHLLYVVATQTYTRPVFFESLLAIVPALVFIPIGSWLQRFVSRTLFDSIIRLTLVLMALRLIYSAAFSA